MTEKLDNDCCEEIHDNLAMGIWSMFCHGQRFNAYTHSSFNLGQIMTMVEIPNDRVVDKFTQAQTAICQAFFGRLNNKVAYVLANPVMLSHMYWDQKA